MRRGWTMAVLVAAALAGGCGGADDDPATAGVEAYVERANAVQQRAKPVFDKANADYRAYAEGELKGSGAELQLRRSELDLADVQQQLAALRPPPEARELHRLLLRTYDLDVALAAETRQMAGYVPRAERTLDGLDAVRKGLRDRLRAARTPARQIGALRSYARRLAVVRSRLARLEVPAVLVPNHNAQLNRLTDTRSLALRLARAIEARDAAAVARLLKSFREAGGPDPVADRLAVGAIRGYQQRVAMVGRATAAVSREQARLLRTLG